MAADRLFRAGQAALDLRGPDIAIVSEGSWKQCQFGHLSKLYLSIGTASF